MKMIKKIIVPRVSIHWEILQAYLFHGITIDETSSKKYEGDSRHCCTALLEEWILSNKGAPKTYTVLLEVICEIPEVASFAQIIKECLEKEGVFVGM